MCQMTQTPAIALAMLDVEQRLWEKSEGLGRNSASCREVLTNPISGAASFLAGRSGLLASGAISDSNRSADALSTDLEVEIGDLADLRPKNREETVFALFV